jgi:drug/metabolite transporter (DMT)-like permease
MQQWRPYIVLAVGLLAVSSASIMIRFAQEQGAPSLVIAAWRLGTAVLVLTPMVLACYRDDVARLTRKQIILSMISGALLGVHFASWITSLEYTSVASSVVLVSTNPVWVALVSPFVLSERMSRKSALAILTAIFGAILISTAGGAGMAPHQESPLLGNGLAIIGAWAIAAYFIIGRQERGRVALIPYIWLTYGSAAIVLCLGVLVTRQTVAGLQPITYVWMTLLGLIPQLIGHSAYNYALGYLSAAYVSLTVLGEAIGSTVLAAIFLGEHLLWLQLLGGVLIMAAVAVASREEARSARDKARQDAQSAVESPSLA